MENHGADNPINKERNKVTKTMVPIPRDLVIGDVLLLSDGDEATVSKGIFYGPYWPDGDIVANPSRDPGRNLFRPNGEAWRRGAPYVVGIRRASDPVVEPKPVETAWALQDKTTGKIDKVFLFESRTAAREWCDGKNYFKPVRVELKIIPGR